jgi:hypothetical protein
MKVSKKNWNNCLEEIMDKKQIIKQAWKRYKSGKWGYTNRHLRDRVSLSICGHIANVIAMKTKMSSNGLYTFGGWKIFLPPEFVKKLTDKLSPRELYYKEKKLGPDKFKDWLLQSLT